MLTPERHRLILDLLKERHSVKIHELVDLTNTSESTIRRDLTQLEEDKYLKRIHGGAALLQGKLKEPNVSEKSAKNLQQKKVIAAEAASLVEEGDCIFLDAGTTTLQMVEYLSPEKEIVVVTNGLTVIEPLLSKGIKTYLIGGFLKPSTGAMIGRGALTALEQYRFDKCFLGVNGIHVELGYTTPDPEEAAMKMTALKLSREKYVLADYSKFGEIAFSRIAQLSEAKIITDEGEDEVLYPYTKNTAIKVVNI
ncbi:DeoR/GlpR family DNA-binding transcription regulator [Metabacillus litoralis]|uniref:DeoR/GlpR family DNA-binding transcription regulator n=1 Tax=Metabacillus TaxID=2675233 RepID=UPI001B968F36|nr:DeoR/GlpR family DNA-binding transcription regulator [Metabacillus litoralis]UHA59470.1 DeoR/GlpR family DNA-binding transcription regulator [Metabacillus litoralis]